jgi:hypothetical protein
MDRFPFLPARHVRCYEGAFVYRALEQGGGGGRGNSRCLECWTCSERRCM